MKTKQSNNSAIMPDAVKIANQRALQPFNLEWENDTVFKKRELNYKTKTAFQKDLDAGKISKYTTVFIKDTKEIYKNGQYYGADYEKPFLNIATLLSETRKFGIETSGDVTNQINALFGSIDNFKNNYSNYIYVNNSAPVTLNTNLDANNSFMFASIYGGDTGNSESNKLVLVLYNYRYRISEDNLSVFGSYDTVTLTANGGGARFLSDDGVYKEIEKVGKIDSNSDGTGEVFNDYENNKATGVFSHAEGYKNNAIGGSSHVEGRECVAQGNSSHSEGYLSTAIGYSSHAECGGSSSIYLSGDAGATQYKIAKDVGIYSKYLTQSELYEHINFSGFYIVDVDNNFSLIKIISSSYDSINDEITITLEKTLSQNNPISKKIYGFSRNVTCGDYSHMEGTCNYISTQAKQGHVEGLMNTLFNDGGHIEGALNIGRSEQCHVEGISNIANNDFEHAQGQYNKSNTGDTDDKKTLHSIGIGAKGARKNAQEVMRNGDHYIIGIGGYDGTNPSVSKTLQKVVNDNNIILNLSKLNSESGHIDQELKDTLSELGMQDSESKYILFVCNNNLYSGTVRFTAGTYSFNGQCNVMEIQDSKVEYLSINIDITQDLYNKNSSDFKYLKSGLGDKFLADDGVYKEIEKVGKVDSNSNGTGEIFNDYENNKATGAYSHASGKKCFATGKESFAAGYLSFSEGTSSICFNGSATNIYFDGEAGATTYEICKTGWLSSSLLKKELINYFKNEKIKIYDQDNDIILDNKIIDVVYKEDGDRLLITFDKTLSDSETFVNKKLAIVRGISSGYSSFVEGYCNYNPSYAGHAEGNDNSLINTQSSHIEGALNYVKGINNDDCIHVEGFCNTAQNLREHAQGNYNKSNTGDTDDKKTIHSIGVGTKNNRKNAQEVMRNGDHYIIGIGGYDGTNPETAQTLQEVVNNINSVSDAIGKLEAGLPKVEQKIVTESEYLALGDTVNSDNVLYFVTPDA